MRTPEVKRLITADIAALSLEDTNPVAPQSIANLRLPSERETAVTTQPIAFAILIPICPSPPRPASGHVIRMLKKDHLDPVFLPVKNPDGSLTRTLLPSGIAPFGQLLPKKSELSRSPEDLPKISRRSRRMGKVRIFLGSKMSKRCNSRWQKGAG